MIKVFISVPMRGRKKEDIEYSIRKMERIARAYLVDNDIEADNIDFINTIVKDNPPKEVDEKIWYLGASIQLLSKADYLICPERLANIPGCYAEKSIFSDYKGYEHVVKIPNRYIYTEAELQAQKEAEAVAEENAICSECEC